MGWTIFDFRYAHTRNGEIDVAAGMSESHVKVHIVHPLYARDVLRDLEARHPGESTPRAALTDRVICLDLGGMIFTGDKRLSIGLSCGRSIEIWPHHADDIAFELKAQLANPARWRGNGNRRWLKFHAAYNCAVLSIGDARRIVTELEQRNAETMSRLEFGRRLRKRLGENRHVLLPGEPGHPIQTPGAAGN